MKIITILYILSCVVTYAYAAAAIFPYEPKPPGLECREGCFLSSLNKVLPYNKPYYPKGKCEQYTCKTNNQTEWFSCGVIAVPPNCRIVQDLTKKYPDCCGRPVCDTTTGTPTTTTVENSFEK